MVRDILDEGERFGRSDARAGERVMVEFVSANPTGPLHVGHGRQAALGDALARLIEWQGATVTREFYYNDAGQQIQNLAVSVRVRAQQLLGEHATLPEDGYRGDYIRELAQRYLDEIGHDLGDIESIRRFAVAELRREQDRDLMAFGVRFDNYFLESSLYSDGRVDATIERLTASGKTYEAEGALWLKTTDFGDDKDRVMRKSDGGYTYFVPDVAYHVTKWERGFATVINVQGGDHHSTVTRVRAGLQAAGLGIPVGYPAYVMHKMVTVMKGGEEVKISKRAGSYLTLRELIDEVGPRRGPLLPGRAQGRERIHVRHRSRAVADARQSRLLCAVRERARRIGDAPGWYCGGGTFRRFARCRSRAAHEPVRGCAFAPPGGIPGGARARRARARAASRDRLSQGIGRANSTVTIMPSGFSLTSPRRSARVWRSLRRRVRS